MQPGYQGWGKLGNMLAGGDKASLEEARIDQTNKNYIAYGNLEQARRERAKAMIAQSQVDARSGLEQKILAQYKARGLMPEDGAVASAFALSDETPNYNTHELGTGRATDATMDRQIEEALTKGDLKRARILSAVKTDKVLPELKGDEVFSAIEGVSTPTKLGIATINKRNYRAPPKATSDASDPGTDVDFYEQLDKLQSAIGRNLKPTEVNQVLKRYKATGRFHYADYEGAKKLGDSTKPDNRPTASDADAKLPTMGEDQFTRLKRQAREAIEAGGDKAKILAKLKKELVTRGYTE